MTKKRFKKFYPFKVSPQMRIINTDTENDKLPVALPQQGLWLYIRKVEVITFTEQADQDLIVTLFVGDKGLFRSGLKTPSSSTEPFADLPFATETRNINTEGMAYTQISSATGLGFPGNFVTPSENLNFWVKPKEPVIFWITNQSVVVKHPVKVSVEGDLYKEY
jgi:hypothetical protein